MIKNIDNIVAQNVGELEWILKEFAKEAVTLEDNGELTITTLEKIAGKTIKSIIQIVLIMMGSFLSNIDRGEINRICPCGKKMGISKRNVTTRILSMFGEVLVTRDMLFCRRCHKGAGVLDKELEIYGEHRITKGMTEIITYMSQLVPSFERASEAIKKLLSIEVNPTQAQIISEEVGKRVFEKEKIKAEAAYEKPELAAPQEVPKNQKNGRLYIFTDGSQVNTRIKNDKGSTWKEMKLGLVFKDSDVIRRSDESHIVTQKEYTSYLGSVSEFKKFLFAAAARSGYGKIKETVIVGDGAAWIWNMVKEVFPDAVEILDYYHLDENINDYAKFIYADNEVKRKRWVKSVIDCVLNGKIEKAIKIIEEKQVDKLPDNIVNLYTYIKNNEHRIDYKAYKEKGYYIGSGAIESANKTVIQQRMKQSGMRWSINGAQYIAALRTKHESNSWDKVIEEIYAS